MPSPLSHGKALLLAAWAAATPACSTSLPRTAPNDMQVLHSSKARLDGASIPAGDVNAAAASNNAFGLALFQEIKDAGPSGNVMFSPYSATLALAMTELGARGDTALQLSRSLAFTLADARAHPALGALDLALTSRGKNAQGKDGQPFRLRIANSTWGQKAFPFTDAFLDALAENYGAGVNAVDFLQDAEGARLLINQWVLDATEQKIKDLVPSGAVGPLTRLVLIDAIYFNAAWRKQFDARDTEDGAFHVAARKDVTVPMMTQTDFLGYAAGSAWQAVELRYDGDEIGLLVLLPAEGKLAEVEASLAGETLSAIVGQLASTNVRLTMPRWRLEWSSSLVEGLKALGAHDAFDPARADLTGIGGAKGELYVSEVLQKTFVAVDERGTEAAAATSVIVGTTSVPPSPVEVRLDRPFLYFIRDVATGAVIFMGRVADPSVDR